MDVPSIMLNRAFLFQIASHIGHPDSSQFRQFRRFASVLPRKSYWWSGNTNLVFDHHVRELCCSGGVTPASVVILCGRRQHEAAEKEERLSIP